MGDRDPQAKPEEQYPLLKIDGGGDMGHPQSQAVASPTWGVTCSNKYSRFSRWPELISACWMTLILCGISFLVFYALGMGVYRRHQFVIMKCNITKPASNVFYHHIVPRGSQVPFVLYTEYLSNMAIQYPLLQFHVFFLIDDSYTDIPRGMRRNSPYYAHNNLYKLDEIGREALTEFQKRYQNVNVTIMPFSKYMAMTSLRYKYKLIPMSHMPFYIRVFSVWQNGGIAMDLRTFNNNFHSGHLTDPRMDAILKQHNDGINTESYTKALNKIEKDEENAVFGMLFGFINHFINETRLFLNRTLALPAVSTQKQLIRTHRSKRETSNESDYVAGEGNGTTTKLFYDTVPNKSIDLVQHNVTKNLDDMLEVLNTTNDQDLRLVNDTGAVLQNPKTRPDNDNGSEVHQVVLFYDFSIVSDMGPTFLLSDALNQPVVSTDIKTSDQIKVSHPIKKESYLLSLDPEGNFIAAASRFHPFLGHFIAGGCLRMPPKFVIQDALLTQCSSLFREDVYCNSIFIL